VRPDRLPLIAAHEERRSEDVRVDLRLELFPSAVLERDGGNIERVQREPVAMRSISGRRTRPAITASSEAVPPLYALSGALAELRQVGREVVHHPMREGSARRVRIVHDERKRPGPRRGTLPCKPRRQILAVTGVSRRYICAIRKGR